MFHFFSKLFGSGSSSKAIRRTYRPALDVLEERVVPAVDAFIWFDAPNAGSAHHSTGAGQQPGNGAFEIVDFSFGVENPTTIGSATGGAGAGKIQFNEFTITKMTDSASPTFFKNCVVGAHFSSVTIDLAITGGNPGNGATPFLQFKFDTVFTTKVDWSGPGDEGPQETVTFVYGQVQVQYQSMTGPVSAGYQLNTPF
jgi:type VI secretion system secreted protein Hcp